MRRGVGALSFSSVAQRRFARGIASPANLVAGLIDVGKEVRSWGVSSANSWLTLDRLRPGIRTACFAISLGSAFRSMKSGRWFMPNKRTSPPPKRPPLGPAMFRCGPQSTPTQSSSPLGSLEAVMANAPLGS